MPAVQGARRINPNITNSKYPNRLKKENILLFCLFQLLLFALLMMSVDKDI